MEEKKKIKKLSYEELENAAKQLAAQLDACGRENAMMRQELQTMNRANMYTEIGLLFKVLELSSHFSDEFVKFCASQIEGTIMSTGNTTNAADDSKEEPKSGEENKEVTE